MNALPVVATVGVIGAGTMGAGIAQLAAKAGHPVFLLDAQPAAAERGKARIGADLEKLVARGKLLETEAAAILFRIIPAADIAALAGAALVVEAIVEDLEIKRRLFQDLEKVTGAETILATNTSSISITAIGRGLTRPGRVVGMHFFNPAPVMKLVEVVSGIETLPEVAASVFATAAAWGKVPVHARSTPGFIVNRVARAYYAEPLRLHEEGVADPATLDSLLTQGGGFRMGPFALMDLIGHDVNFAVSQSVFAAYFQEPRFRPSILQQELVAAGRLGRKTGHGFYDYSGDTPAPAATVVPVDGAVPTDLDLGGKTRTSGVLIALTDGRTARSCSRDAGGPVILFDHVAAGNGPRRVGFATSGDVPDAVLQGFFATLAEQGIAPVPLPDWPGLVVMRTVALLANEAFEAVLQGVAEEAAIDAAMRHGVNYPRGPAEWARQIGLEQVLSVLDNLLATTGDTRYRASLALRRAAGAI